MIDLVSILGYSKGSPFENNPYLDIHTPEGLIDMSNTPIDLIGVDNKGNKKLMKAGRKNPYRFEGDVVREIPTRQAGGFTPEDAYEFLFGDDEEEEVPKKQEEMVNTAPSEEELQEERRRMLQQLSDEEQHNLAMNIAMGEFIDYRKNRTRNPYMGGVGSVSSKSANDSAKYAFEYYQKKGLEPHIAAGIVGNLMQESNLNPNATGDGGKAKGIAQWHPDRFSGLQSWAKKNNRNPYSLETQLDYILEEPGEGQRALNVLKQTKNSGQAAVAFSQTYERPGKPAYQNRIGYARGLHPYRKGGQINKK